jgi:hypothetical protein
LPIKPCHRLGIILEHFDNEPLGDVIGVDRLISSGPPQQGGNLLYYRAGSALDHAIGVIQLVGHASTSPRQAGAAFIVVVRIAHVVERPPDSVQI